MSIATLFLIDKNWKQTFSYEQIQKQSLVQLYNEYHFALEETRP